MKTYDGLVQALKRAEKIIEENRGLDWVSLCFAFTDDTIIKPYYFEVVDCLHAGRNSLRYEVFLK